MSITTGELVSVKDPSLKAKKFTITIDGGYEASVITYGAVITDLIVPDKDGKPTDIMLGCKGLDEYMGNGANHGAVVGRSANRIKDASFVINGVRYQIPKNEGENNLHSGNPGYHNVFWDGKILSEEEADAMILDSKIAGIPGCDGGAVLLSYTSPDGATGFPGNLDTKVLYCWLEDKTFLILYCGKTDKDTIFAPTNHAYFNLRGEAAEGTVNKDLIMINSDKITIKDDMNVPTGELLDVEGTVFDCREYRFIGELNDSDDHQMVISKGIDQNFCLNTKAGTFSFAAAVTAPESGITMECLTDLPGIQIYAGNNLGSPLDIKTTKAYGQYDAICLEAQMVPNAVNLEGFASPVIKAGKKVYHACGYRFV